MFRRIAIVILFVIGVLGTIATESKEEACTEVACSDNCQQIVDDLAEPRPAPATLTATDCVSSNGAPACVCDIDGSPGLISLSTRPGCVVLGRAYECLWDGGEFAGCDVGDVTRCVDACEDLEARRAADAAATTEATIVGGVCGEFNSCHCDIEVAGRCVRARSDGLFEQDCPPTSD